MKDFAQIAKKIHLWLGLSCGILASISGLTGSLYVWQPEITAALNPKLLKIENIDIIPENTLHKTASFLIEKHRDSLEKVFLPYREQQSISIVYKNGKTHYYHPESGKFLGEKSASILFFEDLLKIHRTLGIPKIGKYIMGGSTVLFFLLVLASGAFIWFKKYNSNPKKGFKIKRQSKKKRFNYDIHKVLGASFFIPLLIISISGAYFTYNTYYKSVFKIFDISTSNNPDKKKPLIGNSIHYNDLIQNPDKNYALRAIYFPKNAADVYHFRYIKDRFIKIGLRQGKELKINMHHALTSSTAFHTDRFSDRIAAQMYPVHIGEIAGVFGRILVFVSGFIPIILFVTGLRFYLFRKKR